MTQDELKQAVADAALDYIRPKLDDDTVDMLEDALRRPEGLRPCRARARPRARPRARLH